jgi:hypothetical protein
VQTTRQLLADLVASFASMLDERLASKATAVQRTASGFSAPQDAVSPKLK